ncbi:DNA cytosine methyltransferase [Paenibacillus sp. FSL P4-0288]|uniref:DNA cytosine methyltransferase n=1 Tax=Paenibacillus sp. FSL P4-0288 TaxID=2921633 RepID=UPI0030F93329
MKQSFMKRLYKIKERLYLEAKYLTDYGFGIGQSIAYQIDRDHNKITIVPSEIETKKHVAKTTQRNGKTVPVIDLKGEEVKAFFNANKQFEVEIRKGKIVFTVLEAVQSIQPIVSLDDAREQRIELQQRRYAVGVKDFAQVVNYEQIDIFDLFQSDYKEMFFSQTGNKPSVKGKEKAIKMLSLFSGCGSLDLGFIHEKYDIVFANDRYEKKALRDNHILTYRNNIGNHIIMRDVMELTAKDIPEVDIVVAGIPCVRYSNLNTKDNFRDDCSDIHPIVEQTLNIIKWSKAKAFVFENVSNFLTVKAGIMLKRIRERLNDFGITAKVIDSSALGSPQKRKRAFTLGIKGIEPNISIPPLAEYNTVQRAFEGIENANQQDLFFEPTEKTLERMLYVPQGGNINNVPVHLRAPNKKFSNYCQRLDANKQSPTITHVQDEVFIHPTLNRYLTVRETARLFSLPDDFTFFGSLTSIFEMLKNAVDYRVSRHLAKIIKNQLLPIL